MRIDQAAARLRQALEAERAFGVHELPKPSVSSQRSEKASLLNKLFEEYRDCTRCPLSATRTHVVFGSGSHDARLMFVGEAPGFEEDKQGQPFVGAAGQLLTKIIEAMKLTRADVYIANCLKCRPPENRNPDLSEIASCSPALSRQIEIIEPEVIVALGKFAAQTLLSTEEPISRLRGRFHDLNGTKLMPTFHPAYLLRNPADKKLVWEDMKQVMKALGLG